MPIENHADYDSQIERLGLKLPEPAAPVASYLPTVEHNGLLYISGQLPFSEGTLITGRLGESMGVEEGQMAARQCALMLVAQVKKALGSLNNVGQILKLNIFVNSAPEFSEQPKVANGASDLIEQIFGEAGRHARSAVGVAALPLAAPVEVDAIIAIRAR
jgi:enamine deaminase RidA (YjgF/YER057c/UK114 family)